MAKNAVPKPASTLPVEHSSANKYTGKAVYVIRINHLLAQSIELTIENGVVVSQATLNVPDLPASAIGAGNKFLWETYRGEK